MTIISATRARALGGACALVLLLALPAVALACSCLFIPFETEFGSTSHVFTARSLGNRTAAPEYPGSHYEALQVQAVWKGAVTPVMEVLVADSEGTCGFFLTPGTDYLVFAHEGSPGFPLSTHSCSRTGRYGPQDPIWQQLGPPQSVPAAVTSWGAVKSAYHR